MSIDLLSSSSVQNSKINEIITEVNAIESGGAGGLNITQHSFLSLPVTTWNTSTIALQVFAVRGSRLMYLSFPQTFNVTPNALPSINTTIVTTAQWDSIATIIPPGQTTNRPLRAISFTGMVSQTIATPAINRQFMIQGLINTNGTISIRFVPFSGSASTSATGTSAMIDPIPIILSSPIPL